MKLYRSLFILLLFFFTSPPLLLAKTDTARVLRVVDGDTIEVELQGAKKKVRLIGVDTPESAYNKRTKLQARESNKTEKQIVALGRAAKKYVQQRVHKGDRVKLVYDVQPTDKYGRLLCYVYLPNGTMLNEMIIKNGYAVPLTIPPNVKHKKTFLSAYRYARKKKMGLWE